MTRPAQSYMPAVLRGSLITLRRKCGSDACRCLRKELHETPALSYSLKGATKMLTLRSQDVPKVAAALKRYQQSLRTLDQQALAGIQALSQRIRKEKAQGRTARRFVSAVSRALPGGLAELAHPGAARPPAGRGPRVGF